MEKEAKRILFLYSELAEYFVSALRVLIANENVEVKVVHWPINPEAPFKFNFPSDIEFIDKSSLDQNELRDFVIEFKPDTIISSGWMDKDYLSICKKHFKNVTTVVSLDNHWNSSFKQILFKMSSPFYLKKIFKNAWVPGKQQLEYAHKLGFKNAKEHFYAPNTDFYKRSYSNKVKPHRFLYVGRYVEHKGIFEMWQAFDELKKETTNDWELWCVGVGDEYENRVESDSVKHFGFIQPEEMTSFLNDTSVFILPSKFEPWGVVAHEMAAAGFPLLLSDKIGSKSAFLENGVNGFEFKSHSVDKIKQAMKKVIQKSDEELLEMGKRSSELANKIDQKLWAKTVVEF